MTYVSPMVRARAIVAGEIRASKSQYANCARMVELHSTVIADLQAEEAPGHVFRWIGWAGTKPEQRRRTDLVLHLRHSIERPRNGWLEERHFTAAMAEWDRARDNARKRGLIMPAVHEIPLDTYLAVINGARKQSRTRDTETGTAAPDTGGAPTEGDEVEDDLDEDDDEPDDGADEEPAIVRPLQGREHVLLHLSNAVRAAVAADDMEAVDVANDAISRLCGGREGNQ